jgi:hypothetical protein
MPDALLKTKKALAERAGVSLPTLAKWAAKPGFPKRGKQGWSAPAFDRFAAAALTDAAKRQTGTDADLKRTKLQKQVEILEIQIKSALRVDLHEAKQYVELDDARADLVALAAFARQSILAWPNSVAAMCPNIDVKLYTLLQEQSGRVLASIGEKLALTDTDPEIHAAAEALASLAHAKWAARNEVKVKL